MKFTGRFIPLAISAACLTLSTFVLSTASAQSAPPAQPQQTQDQAPAATGVSNPPADDTITTDEDLTPPATAPAPKPSAAIPMTAPPPVAATPRVRNFEDDIVTTAAPTTTASLSRRSWNPDDDIVSVVPSDPNALASGTNIRVRLSQNLSTNDTHAGEAFHATIDRDVYKDGHIIIPVGSEMRGRVVQVSQGHHVGPHATIRLRPDMILLPDGTAYHLYAEAIQSKVPGTHTDDEGGIQTNTHYKKDAIEYGAGSGAGAIAGAEIAGPVGAGVGTLVGAGVITVHMLTGRPQAANLPQGSVLVFSLTEPMELTPTKN